jgi:hypothetical protein
MAISQATSADLTQRSLRPLTDVEIGWGTIRLRDAFNQILTAVPSVGIRLDAGTVMDPFNQLVIQIQVAMVLRVLSNPDGILEETSDDYTRRLDAAVSTGALYLTDPERALLTAWDGVSDGAFTIRARPGLWPDTFPTLTTDVW